MFRRIIILAALALALIPASASATPQQAQTIHQLRVQLAAQTARANRAESRVSAVTAERDAAQAALAQSRADTQQARAERDAAQIALGDAQFHLDRAEKDRTLFEHRWLFQFGQANYYRNAYLIYHRGFDRLYYDTQRTAPGHPNPLTCDELRTVNAPAHRQRAIDGVTALGEPDYSEFANE
jgi:hypothetical protein